MTEENKEQFTEQEEKKVEITPPMDEALKVVTTKRKSPIKRFNATPLSETHGMTTEADRFKEL